MLVVITQRHSVQECCKMLISAYNNCTKAIDFLTNQVCMSESEKSRLVKDRNSTPFLFPYFWYYQNNFTLWDKLSKISVKVFTLHEATFVFLGVKKQGRKVGVYSNFVVFVFEIPALSVEKMRNVQLECLISVLKKKFHKF